MLLFDISNSLCYCIKIEVSKDNDFFSFFTLITVIISEEITLFIAK